MKVLLPALCLATAGVMGFAIQRGATCTVAAVDELLTHRSAYRLAAMAEAALWVLGGLLAWRALSGSPPLPHGYPVSIATIAGGALLGLGAFVNRACVFGAIARFGIGEWAYAFTPVGYYIGCVGTEVLGVARALPLRESSVVLAASPWWALPLIATLLWRMWPTAQALTGFVRAERVWSPHVATCVIGVAFVVLLLAAGAWTYTDVLAELARGMAGMLNSRLALAIALLVGAALGGWSAGRWRHTALRPIAVLRCLAGGALMACGSLLIPGGNDGLILLGMPLLWPYAWLAFATMCASIAAAMWLRRRIGHPR